MSRRTRLSRASPLASTALLCDSRGHERDDQTPIAPHRRPRHARRREPVPARRLPARAHAPQPYRCLDPAPGRRASAQHGRSHLAGLPARGQERARARSLHARRGAPLARRPRRRRGRGEGARHPLRGALPLHRSQAQERGGRRGGQSGQSRLPRRARGQARAPRDRRALRRGPRPLHQPRPRRAPAQRLRCQRRDGRGAVPPGARPGQGRLRHHRPLRHDGRSRRRHPRGPRPERLRRGAHHGLLGQIRLRLLRPLPRRHRLDQGAQGRQAHLSDGPGQHGRGARARSPSIWPRVRTWSWSSRACPISTSCGG